MIDPLNKQTQQNLYDIFCQDYNSKSKEMSVNNKKLLEDIVGKTISTRLLKYENELKDSIKHILLGDGGIMECGTNVINEYDGCSIVGYNSEKITYINIPPDRKNDWVMSAEFTGCLFALGTATKAFGDFIQDELYAFHVHPIAYYAWEELKKEMENVHEINPYESAYGSPSFTTSNKVTAFINASSLQAILWKQNEQEPIQISNISTIAMNSLYYENKFQEFVEGENFFLQQSKQQKSQKEKYPSESCCQIKTKYYGENFFDAAWRRIEFEILSRPGRQTYKCRRQQADHG